MMVMMMMEVMAVVVVVVLVGSSSVGLVKMNAKKDNKTMLKGKGECNEEICVRAREKAQICCRKQIG
jgi:hypothetical protein